MAHLTKSQRDKLEALVRSEHRHTQTEIADIIGCGQSTISREIQRNSSLVQNRYTANTAQRRSVKRRRFALEQRDRWYDNPVLYVEVIFELFDGKSPDQIAGRMKEQGWTDAISHQAIYDYIEQDKEKGGELYKFLRYQGKKYKWRGFGKDKTKIPNRLDISERPEEVNNKERPGDWESDLVVSCRSGSGAVATFAERTCIYFRAILVVDQSADEMVRATKEALKDLPASLRKTMTHDNGKEICKHEEITKDLKMTVYCARPYRSCDRGLNEWCNRELRRFFPKGTDFSKVTQAEIDSAVEWLNNCPRRSLGYRTPKEVFEEKLQIMHFRL
jgi:transposase, IS30 family